MADYEVPDADIWVGATPPATADPDDFWFDTSAVPLFGIAIIGTLPGAGPPSETNPPDGSAGNPDPGDAWWDSDGNLWVWDGEVWVNMGNFRGPTGPAGADGAAGVDGATGPAGPPGAALDIKGELGTPADLPTDPEINDAYIIGGELYIWNGESWVTVPFVGPAGPTGPTGPSGAGLTIIGSIPGSGPPVLPTDPAYPPEWPNPPQIGDGIVDGDGGIWVWDGSAWLPINVSGVSNGLPPGGAVGQILVKTGVQDYVSGWSDLTSHPAYIALEDRIAALEALLATAGPALQAWIETANWSPDGITEH